MRSGEKSEALFGLAQRRGRAAWRFDFRGHGESSGRLEDLTLSDLLRDAEAVLEEAGPSVLVGSSLGGLVAAWSAARQPHLVRGLCLIAPALGFLDRHAARPRDEGHFVVTSPWSSIRIHERALEDARRYDERELAAAIACPTVIVHGEYDPTVPPALSSHFYAQLKVEKKQLWIVPAGDHRLNAAIAGILEQIEAVLD